MLVQLFEWINDQHIYQSYIWDSFALCGLNPYVEDQSRFKAHMDSLPGNMAYNSLLRTEKSMKLKVSLDGFKYVTLKRMTPKIKMSLSTSLRPNHDGCRNTSLPIYLIVRNIYLITNNDFDLFIQAYF